MENQSETSGPLAAELYSAALEEGGDDPVERVWRFIGGVLTSAFGDYGAGVVGISVVVRRKEDGEEVLRIDVPDAESGDQVLQAMQADLDTYPADEFVTDWLDKVKRGRHVAGHDAEGTRLE